MATLSILAWVTVCGYLDQPHLRVSEAKDHEKTLLSKYIET